MTATEARRELVSIKKAATAFLDQLALCYLSTDISKIAELRDRAESVVCAVDAMSDGARSTLYSYLAFCGYGWKTCFGIRKRLIGLFSVSIYHWEEFPLEGSVSQASVDRINGFVQETLPVLESIKKYDVAILVPTSGRWGDPALANLIAAAEPIWHRVTNLSGARSSEFESRFATWLNSLLPHVGCSKPVPLGLVLDIIRSKKTGTITNVRKTG